MKKIIKSFFYRGDDFQPPYFWITLLMLLVVAMMVMRLVGLAQIDNALVIGVLGFVAAWIGFYNFDRIKNR